ncbi:hypothetical protein BGZ65_011158, partial [Modicella reniformis]
MTGFHVEPPILLANGSSKGLMDDDDDLIVLDEHPITPSHNVQQYKVLPSMSLLDDDMDRTSLLQLAVLKPVIPDLINLSNFDEPDFSFRSGPSTVSTTLISSSSNSSASGSSRSDEGLVLTDDSELEQDDVVLEVDLQQLDKARQLVLDRRGPQTLLLPDHKKTRIESDLEDLLDVIGGDTRSDNHVRGPEVESNPAKMVQVNGDQIYSGLIEQRHRDKLLEEISGGKNSLQAYAAIEVLEMQADLLKPVLGGTETYGWVLARELYNRGRFRESSVVVFEYLEPGRGQRSSEAPSSIQKSSSLFAKRPPSALSDRSESPSAQVQEWVTPPSSITSSQPTPKAKEAVPAPLPLPIDTAKATVTFYELPNTTNVVFVNSEAQLETLSRSLRKSNVIGMDTEWLPQIEEYEEEQPVYSRTAILQLACDADSTVYIVDTIAFLQVPDHGSCLVEVIGDIFNNPRVLKI